MKIIIVGALPESLINFRGELIKEFINLGHEVIAMAAHTDKDTTNRIEQLGCKYIPYTVARNSTNPLSDLKTFFAIFKVLKNETPDKIIAYTIKPVIWSGISARFFSKIEFYALITGLGFAFQPGNLKRKLVKLVATTLYKVSLAAAKKVIFQNNDNMQTFITNKIITQAKSHVINGSGVNLKHFQYSPLPENSNFTFLTIARLLGDKGLREYVAAAKIVTQKYKNINFKILGPEDPSPDGIGLEEVYSWQEQGSVEYLGNTADVRPFISQCDIFVLASYHEGLPRTVIEAMAMGRAIITTNVPGCRDTVQEGVNGFLVNKEDAHDLANKMLWFIENKEKIITMSHNSLALAQEKYDVKKINANICNIIELN